MPGEEIRDMEMSAMAVQPEQLMELADKADMVEEQMMPTIEGDFSVNRVNKLVDAMNRVNKLFKAPMYPKFDKAPNPFPPEFIKNLQMIDSAVMSAGMEEYEFSLEDIKDDGDLKTLAGKMDAMASDKSFKAFLNKPLGMGEFQKDQDVPMMATKATKGAIQQPSADAEAEVDLFMSRMA